MAEASRGAPISSGRRRLGGAAQRRRLPDAGATRYAKHSFKRSRYWVVPDLRKHLADLPREMVAFGTGPGILAKR